MRPAAFHLVGYPAAGPYYLTVHPIAILVAGLFGGLVIGICITWLAVRSRPSDVITDLTDEPPQVPEGISAMLDVLSSSAVVVGPHDEVLEATTSARTQGLARGSRVAVPEVLDLVREVRRERRHPQPRPGTGTRSQRDQLSEGPRGSAAVTTWSSSWPTTRRRCGGSRKRRRDFVVNISHELKTPIGAISLLAEAAEEAADDPPAVRKFASRLSVESARLADLVSQIIDLSRLQADDPLANAEEVDIDEILTEAVDRCQVDADQHRVSLTVAGATGCRVLGSARQLSVAVGNLVENAVVYSDPGARVVVAAHRQARSDDDYVEITVSDNGIGIPPGELERIFERFYRVDYARSRANGGTGLGLAIVKHIAATHGGDVSVWSQPGHGSTFTIRIPEHVGVQQSDQRAPPDVDSELHAEDQESRL